MTERNATARQREDAAVKRNAAKVNTGNPCGSCWGKGWTAHPAFACKRCQGGGNDARQPAVNSDSSSSQGAQS